MRSMAVEGDVEFGAADMVVTIPGGCVSGAIILFIVSETPAEVAVSPEPLYALAVKRAVPFALWVVLNDRAQGAIVTSPSRAVPQ